ncbi:MAG: glycosyltransferase family 2 protein [Thiopseudomonas sp.]|nr:glycosyltransferase family 2 protein [Thiopseudomonas sp.]MCK9464766.1 glycosyltransferase family 2 protein [Thiopseudomonas sp.]
MKNTDYSIVVPVYKSTNSLKILTQKVHDLFNRELQGKSYELILVNDSPFHQATCEILAELHQQYSFVKIIEFTQNFGQQSAVLCGIANSIGDYIITLDDDMQHDPADIPKLIEQQSHDIVIAKFKTKKHNLFKRATSSIKGYFDYIILDKPKHIKLTSFRLINRIIADNLLKIGTSYPFIPALLFSVSKDIVNVEVEHYAREDGKSNYTLGKMIQVFTNLLISNSSLLLKWIGYLGLTVALISLMYAGVIVYRRIFFEVSLQGWSSIMVTILFFGGTIMFTLGVIGEYLVRIIHTSENKPHYFIRDVKDKREA